MATTAQHPTIEAIDVQLVAAGMPAYSELLALLNEVDRVALDLHIGRAYISRSYIDTQTELSNRIKAVNEAVAEKHAAAA